MSGEDARDAVSIGARFGVRPGGAVGDKCYRDAGGRRGGAAALACGAGVRRWRAALGAAVVVLSLVTAVASWLTRGTAAKIEIRRTTAARGSLMRRST